MPLEIKQLLLPNPVGWQQEYRNLLVRSMYENVPFTGMLSISSFISWCQQERESRLKVYVSHKTQLGIDDAYHSSKDGRWVNVRNYLNAAHDTVRSHGSGAKTFLESNLDMIEKSLKDLAARRAHVSKNNPLKVHHLNEINFFDELEARMESGKIRLQSLLAEVTRKLSGVGAKGKGKVSLRNRVAENKKRNEEEKVKRLHNRAGELLGRLLKGSDGTLEKRFSSRDWDFKVCSSNVNVFILAELKCRADLDPLQCLLDSGIFEDDALLHDQVLSRIEELNEQKKKTTAKNLFRKEREAKKEATTNRISPLAGSKRKTSTTVRSSKKKVLPPPSEKEKITSLFASQPKVRYPRFSAPQVVDLTEEEEKKKEEEEERGQVCGRNVYEEYCEESGETDAVHFELK